MSLIEIIKEELKDMLSKKRYEHTLRVAETAKKLAKYYKVRIDKAELAAILHDCGKKLSHDEMLRLIHREYEIDEVEYNSPSFLHGFAGVIIARNKFRVDDKEVLDAIKYHTIGRKRMTLLDKIIYISDVIEPGRKGESIQKIRNLVYKDLDRAILFEIEDKIRYLIENGRIIHSNAIDLRNYLIIQMKKKG